MPQFLSDTVQTLGTVSEISGINTMEGLNDKIL